MFPELYPPMYSYLLSLTYGRDVGFADHDLETMNAIERELEYLQRLMAANEGYQAEPEIDADGSNQMDEAQ